MNRQTSIVFLLIVTLGFMAFPVRAQEGQISEDLLFSGPYLKFGWITSPKVEAFGDKWIAALGFDKGIKPFLSWGMEIQPYFRSVGEGDFKFSTVAGNLFFNLKGGYSVGRLINVKALKFLNPLKLYGGLGLGAELSYTSFTMDGESSSDFNLRFAWRLMFGLEYELKEFSLIFEIQPVKVINPELDPKTVSTSYILFGIRF